ncbi:MAG: triose-phosphate isomerase [Alphaproteobacteria bacterium]|nr:triose-phosphate isomerase [Alphaproteobacteria bacterium]
MKRLIIANWKMNGSKQLIQEFRSLKDAFGTVAVICPPACFLPLLAETSMIFGGQNCHYATSGAFTGEISAAQLKELGCTYVILGHSERRSQFKETDSIVNQKAAQAIERGLIPIICMGETYEERHEGRFEQVLLSQLDRSTHRLNPQRFVIAYEPIWSIGTGLVATENDIQNVITLIQGRLGDTTPIIYGGSVNDKNAEALSNIPGLNGVLVGGASLNVPTFQSIIDAFQV